MASRRKERIATGTVGAGMIAGSGVLRHKGTEMNHKLAGVPEPKLGPLKFKSLQHYRKLGVGGRKGRALFAGGTALGLMGAPAVATAVTNTVPARQGRVQKASDSKPDFLGAGLQGTKDAVNGRARNLREKKPARAVGTSYGVGAVAALGGSLAAHQAFDARDKTRLARGLGRTALRHPSTAVAGAVAGAASIPLTNRVMRHTAPGYVVTPSGVKRAKTPPRRPSSKSTSYEGRSSRGANQAVFRHQVVGKLFDSKTAPGMDREQTLRQIKAKRRKLTTDTATTGLGLAGVGLLAARHVPKIAAKHPNLERHALGTAIASGGVGAVGGVQGIRITRRDLRAQEKALNVQKMGERLGARYTSTLLHAAERSRPKPLVNKTPGVKTRLVRTGRSLMSSAANKVSTDATHFGNPLLEMAKSQPKPLVMPYFPPKHEGKPTLNMVVKAAWGPQLPTGALKAVAPRQSYLKTVRAPGGILKPVRVKAAMG